MYTQLTVFNYLTILVKSNEPGLISSAPAAATYNVQ